MTPNASAITDTRSHRPFVPIRVLGAVLLATQLLRVEDPWKMQTGPFHLTELHPDVPNTMMIEHKAL